MTTVKLKIDLAQGILEVEGDSSFVQLIYSDFKEQLAGSPSGESPKRVRSKKRERPTPSTPPKAGKIAKKKSGGSSSGAIVKDLDLSGAGKTKRLKDFHGEYKAKNNYDHNLIFVYYLQHKLGIEDITIDHIFTCYRDVGVKVPGALQQSLWDTSNRKGWLDTSTAENITVSVSGMNFLEHDMPKKESDE